MMFVRSCFYYALVFVSVSCWGDDALGTWHLRNPSFNVQALKAVAYGNGRFIAVGEWGNVMSSTNGVDWVLELSLQRRLKTVAFLDGRFYMGGLETLSWSEDGVNWTDATNIPPTVEVYCIGFGRGTNNPAGLFLAFGTGRPSTPQNETFTFASQDGSNWTILDRRIHPIGSYSSTNRYLPGLATSVAYGFDRFVVTGSIGGMPSIYHHLFSSPDGTNWFLPRFDPSGAGAVAFGDRFVAPVNFGLSELSIGELSSFTSTNGTSWQGQSFSGSTHLGVCYGAGRYVAVGAYAQTAWSTNGRDWEEKRNASNYASYGLHGVTYGDGVYVAVGDAGVILTSTNGADWIRQACRFQNAFFGAGAYGKDGFAVVGDKGTVMVSTNGVEWHAYQQETTNILRAIAEHDGYCVAVGQQGTILSGTDLQKLIPRISHVTLQLNDVCRTPDEWVVVGSAGTILTSSDGEQWVQRESMTGHELRSITYGRNRVVAIGNTTACVSTNAIDWQSLPVPLSSPGPYLISVAFGRDCFVAVTSRSALVSSNGLDWVEQPLPGGISKVVFGSGEFVLFYDTSAALPLANGLSNGYSLLSGMSTGFGFDAVAYNNGVFLAANTFSVIMASAPVSSLAVARVDNLNRVTIFGPRQQAYQIEISDALSGGWQPLLQLPAEPQTERTFDDPSDAPTDRFYRAKLIP